MKISKNFQGLFFGCVIDDVYKNYGQIKIPDFKWENQSEVILQKHEHYNSPDELRRLLKIFDIDFPKRHDGEPVSMKYRDNKSVVKHIEYIRYVLSHNGAWLQKDEEDWQRMIQENNR